MPCQVHHYICAVISSHVWWLCVSVLLSGACRTLLAKSTMVSDSSLSPSNYTDHPTTTSLLPPTDNSKPGLRLNPDVPEKTPKEGQLIRKKRKDRRKKKMLDVFSSAKYNEVGPYDPLLTIQNKEHGKTRDRHKKGTSTLYRQISSLQTKLLDEIVKNQELRETLTRHSDHLSQLNHTLSTQQQDYSHIQDQVSGLHHSLRQEEEYHQSIDHKLAGVMLDIAEVNSLLQTQEKRGSVKLSDKYINVQASSAVPSCALSNSTSHYRDCEEVYHRGHTKTGVYYITPLYASCPIPVFCDMTTPPGGWMVIQRRQDGSTDFNQDWKTYRAGFGDVTGEFWLGNDNLFLLTNQKHYQLRVDLWDFYGSRVYADYQHFKVEGERDRYTLHVSNHSGTAPDGLSHHDGVYFSTPDSDNDQYADYHCAKEWSAGWWFNNCWFAILNGKYHNNTLVEHRGISWNDWKTEQLQKTEMKIRPSGF